MQTSSRKLPAAWPVVIFLLTSTCTHAETAVQAWAQRYGSGGSRATAVAADGSNNVIVTGYHYGHFATIKYSSVGVPLWTNRYAEGMAEEIDYPTALAVDADNEVIVVGYWQGGFFPGPANQVTVKYSSAGVPLWTNHYYGQIGGDDRAYAVAVDGSNNVVVTGTSYRDGSAYDYATIKYSPAGQPLWTNLYNGPGLYDAANAVAGDRSGSVIVTGLSRDSGAATLKYSSAGVPLWTNLYNGPRGCVEDTIAVAVDASSNVIVMAYSGGQGSSYDYATIKYSSAGVPLWTNRYNGPGNGNDLPRALAVDASNNVIVTGFSGLAGATNYATLKYSSAGAPLWTNRYNSPGSTNDCACAVAVDRRDNVIVTGYSMGPGTSYDYVTIGYSSAGLPLWTNRYNGPGNSSDYAAGMAVDRAGNVIVTGYSTSTGGQAGYFATVKYAFPLLITQSRLAGGAFEMLVDNLQPDTLVIEAATNLPANPLDWSPIFTNTAPTNGLSYTDPEAGSLPTRFYRAFQFP